MEARLGTLRRVYSQTLQSLHQNKKDWEIGKITEDSSIKLSGKSRPVQMLKIEMVPLEENNGGIEKIKAYIESCISRIREQ